MFISSDLLGTGIRAATIAGDHGRKHYEHAQNDGPVLKCGYCVE
jgi:hypothetical protein